MTRCARLTEAYSGDSVADVAFHSAYHLQCLLPTCSCSRAFAAAGSALKVGANGPEYILPEGAREDFNKKGACRGTSRCTAALIWS